MELKEYLSKERLIENIIEHIIDTPNFSGGIDGSDREELIELLNQLFDLGKNMTIEKFKEDLNEFLENLNG